MPASSGFGAPTVLSETSACVAEPTTTVAVAELGPNAWLVEVAVTVSLILVPFAVPAFTFNTRVTVPLDPAGADAAVHVIVPVPPTGGVIHDVPGGAEIDWNVVFVGVVSVIDGLLAVPDPVFVTVCV